ncbi:MAG: hypothetical protein Q7S52_02690 [bacterium]|nr:hypothetical protein [bacterium]
MSHFKRLPEFENEFARLKKKYRTLEQDLADLEQIIECFPTGRGKNFAILHNSDDVVVVKARMACDALRNNSLRIIYAYHGKDVSFVHIELYFKGEKENENRQRIKEYLKLIP